MLKITKLKVKELNNIAVPLIIQSISGLTIGLADQAMVGRISIFAFGAVGVIFSLLSFIAGIIGYISVVFNINGSKALGKGSESEYHDNFISALIINIFIGCFFLVVILFLKRPLLVILFKFSGEMLNEAIKYSNIMSGYILIQLLLFNFGAVFKIKKNTKWILIGSTVASVVNLVLDYVFIFGKLGFPKMGTTGAALSSIIGIMVNLGIYVFLCKDILRFHISKIAIYKKKIRECIKESISFMGQELLEGSIFVLIINAILSRIGVIELSSYLILVQLINIILMPMFMYGSATLTIISEGDGKGNKELLESIPKLSIAISVIIYFVLAALLLFLRNYVPQLITNDTKVIVYTADVLIYMLIAHSFGPASTIYKYSLQAIGESKYVLFATAKINCIALILMIVFIYVLKFNIYGVFLALFLNYIFIYLIYLRKYNKVIHNRPQLTLENKSVLPEV